MATFGEEILEKRIQNQVIFPTAVCKQYSISSKNSNKISQFKFTLFLTKMSKFFQLFLIREAFMATTNSIWQWQRCLDDRVNHFTTHITRKFRKPQDSKHVKNFTICFTRWTTGKVFEEFFKSFLQLLSIYSLQHFSNDSSALIRFNYFFQESFRQRI